MRNVMSVERLKAILEEKEYTIVKYVRTTTDVFRFGDLYNSEHRDLLDKDEVAASAGLVVLDNCTKKATLKGESMTLHLTPDAGDAAKIVALLFQNNVMRNTHGRSLVS